MKIPRNQPCPCGSQKKFKHCCMNKAYSIVDADEDAYTIELPMSNEVASIFERQAQEFLQHFEREAGPGDPVFLAKYTMSATEIERHTVEAMESAGIDPAKIYAYRKTGRLIGENFLDNYPHYLIEEWDAAIEEYDELGGDFKNAEAQNFDQALKDLQQSFESILYALGLANDKFFNAGVLESPGPDSTLSTGQYQALCISRVHRTLLSIRHLVKEHLPDDIMKLARSIYESYLHVTYVGQTADAVATLVDAVVGLKNGTHAYKKRPDGKEDKRWIVDLRTGRELAGHVPVYKMASSSPVPEDLAFFDFFYKTTSEFLHPSVFALDGYLSEHGLDPVKPHMYEEAVVFTACVCAMTLDTVRTIKGCPDQVATDCATVVRRVKRQLLEISRILDVWVNRLGATAWSIDLLRARCERLTGSSA
ncbi:SEC-C metal-binding domain-containing protein [Paraburkholderia nemoris]|uniref:DUF5677 domain-containing protein n=1 Tax=Paraburkholderia nemoris TaxID=2793076 RepID=UPI0038B7A70E